MKKAERIFGIAGILLFALGTLFKYMHWPSAGIQINLSFLLFNFGYLPLNLIINYRKREARLYHAYVIIRFITLFIIMSGFVFKVMHFPGAGILLILGSPLLPILIGFYFFLRYRNLLDLPFQFQDLIIAIIAYGIYFWIIQSVISPDVIEGYVKNEMRNETFNAGIATSNRMIYESLDSIYGSGNNELMATLGSLRNESDRILRYVDSVQGEFMVAAVGVESVRNEPLASFNSRFLSNRKVTETFFNESGQAEKLGMAVDRFMSRIERITREYHLSSSLIGLGLPKDGEGEDPGSGSRISGLFERLPIAAAVNNLSWLKQMVLLTENTILNSLISQMDLPGETVLLQELAAREADRAMEAKEGEILQIKQQQEIQQMQQEQLESDLRERNTVLLFAFVGIAFVIVMLVISTRAYMRKQKDNKRLEEQKKAITDMNDELNQVNEEIAAQRDEIEAQRDTVSAQKEQIEKTHQAISASIEYARRLQASILPGDELVKKHFADHLLFFRPRDKVSGDFYWWAEEDGAVIIAVADCTGHGVPGAFMSMLGVSLLREIVNKEHVTGAGEILNRLREEVIRSLNQTGAAGEQKDGMDIAVICLDPGTGHAYYAGANNPVYLLRNGDLLEYKPDRMPISIYDRMDAFIEHDLRLEKGDRLYLFSDGYADQFGGKDRKKFKYKAFKQLLLDHSGSSMADQQKVLAETIEKWQGNYEQIDDMVVVGLKV